MNIPNPIRDNMHEETLCKTCENAVDMNYPCKETISAHKLIDGVFCVISCSGYDSAGEDND